MAVGKSSLIKASKGLNTQKTIDKKTVQSNTVLDADIKSLIFTKKAVDEKLLLSIKKYGVICPIIAVKSKEGLVVVDGVKRLSCLKKAKINTVKTVVVEGKLESIKKELATFSVKTKTVKKETEKTDLHEEKFKAVSNIYSELPFWML